MRSFAVRAFMVLLALAVAAAFVSAVAGEFKAALVLLCVAQCVAWLAVLVEGPKAPAPSHEGPSAGVSAEP